MIKVVAIITAKPGVHDQVLAHFNADAAPTRAEPGCISYDAYVD